MTEINSIDIPAKSIIKILLVILAFVFLYLLRDVLMIVFFAIMIASAVSPFATWLEKKKIPRLVSVLVFYIVFFGLAVLFLSLVIPVVSHELNQLTQALPSFFEGVSDSIKQVQDSTRFIDIVAEIQNLLQSFSNFLQITSTSIATLFVNIFGGIISLIAIIIISFYFSVMKQGVSSFLESFIPDAYEQYVIDLWHRAEAKVGKWFQGQLLLALTVGLVVFVGLSLLNIKYALLLGIIAMAFELIPFVGPVLAAIPAIILALIQSPALGFWVLIFYVGVQQLEAHILAPLIVGKSVGLHPVTVIISLLIGGKLAGILGVLLAVPVAVVVVEIIDDLAVQRQSRKVSS